MRPLNPGARRPARIVVLTGAGAPDKFDDLALEAAAAQVQVAPDRLILPGQFVRVEIQVGTVDGVLVPQRATSRSADGSLTAFVVRDGRADEVELTENGTTRNSWIVTDGIAEGDQLVLDGLDNLRDGAAMRALVAEVRPEAVIHFAGLKAVGESVADPLGYYFNNTAKARSLIACAHTLCSPSIVLPSASTPGAPMKT